MGVERGGGACEGKRAATQSSSECCDNVCVSLICEGVHTTQTHKHRVQPTNYHHIFSSACHRLLLLTSGVAGRVGGNKDGDRNKRNALHQYIGAKVVGLRPVHDGGETCYQQGKEDLGGTE